MEELKQYLRTHRHQQFAEAFTTKLLTYALGRSLELADERQVKELSSEFVRDGYKIANLIQLVVASEAFQSK